MAVGEHLMPLYHFDLVMPKQALTNHYTLLIITQVNTNVR